MIGFIRWTHVNAAGHSNKIPQILYLSVESPFALGFASIGVDLRFGKAKDQNAGSFDQSQNKSVRVAVEFDRDCNRGIDALGNFIRPRLEFGRCFVASSRAQHK